MKIGETFRRRSPHAPVNPYTGVPNSHPDEVDLADPASANGDAGAPAPESDNPVVPENAAAPENANAPVTSSSGATASEGCDAVPDAAAFDDMPDNISSKAAEEPLSNEPSQVEHFTNNASSPAGQAAPSSSAAFNAEFSPAQDAPSQASAPSSRTPDVPPSLQNEALIDRFRSVLDSRIVSTVILVVLLYSIVGLDNFLTFIIAAFIGYLLLDRFVNVRRCIVLGGISWLVVIVVGNLVVGSTSVPIFFSIDYLFMFSGFLLALAVCLSFFVGRALYEYGMMHGQEEADRAIARHIVNRLIEHPDDWSDLDGAYLESESAINLVRESQRTVEQSARDEARRKDDLVTYLAHDLKTPLASVVGYLSLLEEAPDLPVEQRVHFTGIALDKAHRLDALIEEFFDITRFDFHDIVLTRGYVDLNLMLGQVVDEFYPTLAEQGKEVELDVPAGLVALIDGDKMARVFNNVMKNAIAYSYEGSTIRIVAERAGESSANSDAEAASRMIIRFVNQGDPIPEAKLKVIFEKFYRLDAARATNRGGAGLGLAIAKEIVTAHGGSISCSSTPECTVFTIALPA